MSRHWLRLELKKVDRNTDRETWKEFSRWLRMARNEVERKLKYIISPKRILAEGKMVLRNGR